MSMKNFPVYIFLLSSINLAVASPNLQEATDDVCHCMEGPNKKAMEIMRQMSKAQASGDMSKMTLNQGEMMNVMSEATRCFERLPEKYLEIDKSEELQNRVMAMAEKQCPNPATQFMMQR